MVAVQAQELVQHVTRILFCWLIEGRPGKNYPEELWSLHPWRFWWLGWPKPTKADLNCCWSECRFIFPIRVSIFNKLYKFSIVISDRDLHKVVYFYKWNQLLIIRAWKLFKVYIHEYKIKYHLSVNFLYYRNWSFKILTAKYFLPFL